ncbi:MAG TPA: hypothetical protein VHL34_20720 [Rhizomicrobium sp.]|jgi:hypothetical protein|nr:hypothetical protein [Rhizomicrobium sp.]
MMRTSAALAIGLLLPGCNTADATPPKDANPDFTCTLAHPSKSVNTLRKLPSPVKVYVKAKVGTIADRGQFFNAGDVVTKPAPFNRFIRGGGIGDGYFLWYEHGGFAYWKQIVPLDRSGVVIAEAHGHDLCADTDALLDKPAETRKP